MASALEQTRCCECKTVASIALCHGCEQSFCTRHFIRHRLRLGQQMDEIHHHYQSIEQCLRTDPNEHPVMAKIYSWERKSIQRIAEIAETARNDFRHWLEQTRSDVQRTLKRIDQELRLHENVDNFTELDLQRWTQQLNELKEVLESPTKLPVVEEKKPSATIGTLKVRSPRASTASANIPAKVNGHVTLASPLDEFVAMFGPCELSKDRLIVTQCDYRSGLSQITGKNEYSSGRHTIRLLIEKKGTKNIFIGIHSPHARSSSNRFDSSVYGWWNLDYLIVSGESQAGESSDVVQTGDLIDLILDCDQRKIHFEHHRTNQVFHIPIQLDQCPFPWKILVRLLTTGDRLRLIR